MNMGIDIQTDVAILKRDIDRMSELFDKIDITIEKLSDVSISLNRMIAVQETRLVQQEDTTRRISTIIEEHRKQTEDNYEVINTRLNRIRDEMKDDMLAVTNKMTDKIDKLTTWITHIDRWKFAIIGGALVIGFLLSRLPILEHLTTKI